MKRARQINFDTQRNVYCEFHLTTKKNNYKQMKNTLLSAFSCNPMKGSEESYGWNWSVGLVREGYAVHTITRLVNKADIESQPKIANLSFHYIALPLGLERLYSMNQTSMYLYYMLWQWLAYRKAKQLHKKQKFDKVHHVTWGSIQQGSFMYKLDVPFIFGPAGGGQLAPTAFQSYFKEHWVAEEKREKVSQFLFKYNPACRKMLQKAELVLVSNNDTLEFAQQAGAKHIHLTLDAGLPESFFPSAPINHHPQKAKLKLLWVGRFLPRKGILLTLEVMKALSHNKEITLTIVGDGQMREYVTKYIDENGLSETVKLAGSVPFSEVKNKYATHDAFFFTSLRESGGVQLVEAMAYSLPIITIDLHGQGQIVTDSTGIKVPLTTPEKVVADLSKAILDLSVDTERYNVLSVAAYNFAKEQIWEKRIKEIVSKFY